MGFISRLPSSTASAITVVLVVSGFVAFVAYQAARITLSSNQFHGTHRNFRGNTTRV